MSSEAAPAPQQKKREYVVVARRYRPQTFEDLAGQGQAVTALTSAIKTDRVGHAYLFTGARGVGKTSTARIFAKALNCVRGPTPTPCNECDICEAVSQGEDVDVLEMDGASNRGIDEIRQLRSNAHIRPSRSRYKIYIIDEVHMLTREAFNALLKTLEEPPGHVKFIFCTTDPEKIPITVLSRCQRFDFAPVRMDEILARLRHIAETEGAEVEEDALKILARRAAGSMRDSQSLLEQLLSFGGGRITAADVQSMLGIAAAGRLAEVAAHLVERDAAAALAALDRSVQEGVDVGQFAEQLLGYFRDCLAAAVGAGADILLHADPGDHARLAEMGKKLGLETVLAAIQILDQAVARMRQTTQVRALVEVALVRICRLEQLDELAGLVAMLKSGETRGGGPPASAQKKTALGDEGERPREGEIASRGERDALGDRAAELDQAAPLTAASAEQMWKRALEELGDMTATMAGFYQRVQAAAGDRIVVSFPAKYSHQRETCERPDKKQRLEEVLSSVAGRRIRIDFEASAGEPAAAAPAAPRPTRLQLMREKEKHPLVSKAIELFDGEVVNLSR